MKNPFDFANPVTNRDLFAGRRRELSEVEYYVDLARGQKGIGLAFVGARTSGKTSLLNMAQESAASRGFLTVRLNLTSADVLSEEAFLRSFYEALFLAGRDGVAWGDTTDAVYAAFRNSMDGVDTEGLRAYCNIAFPQMSAAARRTGQPQWQFPVGLLVSDVVAFRGSYLTDTSQGLAVLMDEGDQLAQLPVALEKLRHLMSLAENFLVVIAGTDNMLGSMDAVFAPIVRQFKRITLTPFISASETRECLLQRLRRTGKAGILTHDAYEQLHALVQGQPYEAQLIAHYAYRRFEDNPDDGFVVTVPVLNEVLAQVERFRDSDHNRFAATLRKYDVEDLQRLAAIVLFPRLSLAERAKVDTALRHPGRVKERIEHRRRELKSWSDRFVNDRVLVYNKATSGYELFGDQFDWLYAKLLARTKGIPWILDDRSLVELSEEYAAVRLNQAVDGRTYPRLTLEPSADVAEKGGQSESELAFVETRFFQVMGKVFRHIRSWRFREQVRTVIEKLGSGESKENTIWMPTVVAEIAKCAVRAFGKEGIPTCRVALRNDEEGRGTEIWLQPRDIAMDASQWEEQIVSCLREHRPGMEAIGWQASLVATDVEKQISPEMALTIARSAGWDAVVEQVLKETTGTTVARYLQGEIETAHKLAKLGLQFAGDAPDRWWHLNNVGYMHLVAGRLGEAELVLKEACESIGNAADLPHYNLCVCHGLQGLHDVAHRGLKILIGRLGAERLADDPVSVLIVLRLADSGALEPDEVSDIPVLEATRRSARAIEAVIGPG